MTITLLHMDNLDFSTERKANLIYADMIYEDFDFRWIDHYWSMLADNAVFIVQTDYHTAANVKLYLDTLPNARFIAEVIYKQEWGGVPKKGFPMKHDNIYIYANGKNWKWHGDRIQIKKVTAGTKLDKKGTGLKTPCSVFDDLGNFSTLAKERVKDDTGKNIQWQKSLALMRRLVYPFVDAGDFIIDPFCGSGTTGIVADEVGCDFTGIEKVKKVYNICKKRFVEEGLM